MGPKLKFLKQAMEEAKKVPKAVWIASAIVPGGFTVLGAYFIVKGLKKAVDSNDKSLKEIIKEWKDK